MLKTLLIIIGLNIFLFVPLIVKGNFLPIDINEIAWMGDTKSYNNEWIELHNNKDKPINIDGWILKSKKSKLKINLSGIIPAKGFFLLKKINNNKKANNNSFQNIKVDLYYKGILNNKGDCLNLYNKHGKLIDIVDCSSGWFAGNNRTKQTMERINSSLSGNNAKNWQTSKIPNGTPKKINDKQVKIKNKHNSFKNIKYPSGIIFSEIFPSPKGSDVKNEWIEIQNKNKFKVSLSGWKIKDKKGKITIYTFPPNTIIKPFSFLILKRTKTKIALNNNGDGLDLINPNKKIIDSVFFEKAHFNQSYNRLSKNHWKWSSCLTPGRKNIILISTTKKITKNKHISQKYKKIKKTIDTNHFTNFETVNIEEKIPKKHKNSFVLLISLIIAFSSAITILIFKKIIIKKLL